MSMLHAMRLVSATFIILAATLAATPVFAGWYTPTSGTTVTLNDIDTYSGYVVAVGNSGTIRRSTANGGGTWSAVTSGTTSALYGVDMYSGVAIAVGYGGVILRSTDNGATWSSITSPTTASLYDVSIGTGNRVFAVGYAGTLIQSTDNGATWSAVSSGVTSTLQAVSMYGSTRAYAVGSSGTILYWNGSAWSAQTSGTTQTLYGVSMISTTEAWAVGSSGGVLKTTNASTWSTSTTITGKILYNISMASSTSGAIMASDGLYETTNGTTWSNPTTGTWTGVTWILNVQYSSSRFAVGTSGNIRRYDAQAPTVGSMTPTTALEGVPATFSVTASDEASVIRCDLELMNALGSGVVLDGADADANGTWTADYTLSAGTYTMTPTCYDEAYNSTIGTAATLTVTGANEDPTISAFDVSVSNGDVSFSIDATDSDGTVSSCSVVAQYAQDVMLQSFVAAVTPGYTELDTTYNATSGRWEVTGVFADADWEAYAYCEDEDAGYVESNVEYFTVDADSTAPTVGTLSVSEGAVNETTNFSVSASDDIAVTACTLVVIEGYVMTIPAYTSGEMTYSAGAYRLSYTFNETGEFTAYVYCEDSAGNQGYSPDAQFEITTEAAADSDTTAPTIGTPSPSTFTLGTSSTVTATVSDDTGIDICELYVDAESVGVMTVSGGTASKSYTFSTNDWDDGDTAIITVECADDAGNVDSTSRTVTLATTATDDEETETEDEATTQEEEETTNDDGDAEPGALIKLPCSEGAEVNDPCKAVYFYSEDDSKRHAFPNEKAFFSWYDNFDDVIVVSDEFMSSLTLGRNVTYRPGTRMVKFVTVNTVYIVTKGGVLRPIDSEATATLMYGANWNTYIDDISDAFYGNYTFGETITEEDDYDVDAEREAISTIDEDFFWR